MTRRDVNRSCRVRARAGRLAWLALGAAVGCGPGGPTPLHARERFDGRLRIIARAGDDETLLAGRLTFVRGAELRFEPDDNGPVIVHAPAGARMLVGGEERPLDAVAQQRLLVLMTAVLSGPRDADAVVPLDDDEGYRIEQADRSIEVRFVATP